MPKKITPEQQLHMIKATHPIFQNKKLKHAHTKTAHTQSRILKNNNYAWSQQSIQSSKTKLKRKTHTHTLPHTQSSILITTTQHKYINYKLIYAWT